MNGNLISVDGSSGGVSESEGDGLSSGEVDVLFRLREEELVKMEFWKRFCILAISVKNQGKTHPGVGSGGNIGSDGLKNLCA